MKINNNKFSFRFNYLNQVLWSIVIGMLLSSGCNNNQSVENKSSGSALDNLPLTGMNSAWQDFSSISTGLPFVNAIKIAGRWRGEISEFDENGYPSSLEKGESASISVFRRNGKHYPLGDYKLMWDGKGKISVSTGSSKFDFGNGDNPTQIIPVTERMDEGIKITIHETEKGDHIRNIRLYLPGYDENSGIWTKHYIEDLKTYGLIRFMWGSGAWCYTDTIVNWGERRSTEHYNWLAGDTNIGIPYEAMVELANATGNDLWVCVPVAVNKDFMRKMAEFFRDNLNPEIRFWVEYTNEYWLDIDFFTIISNDYLQGLVEKHNSFEGNEKVTVSQLYARKSIELFEIFTEVFSETNESNRLIRAICGTADDSTALKETTDEFVRLNKMDLVDVFGIGPYFRPYKNIGNNFEKAVEQGWDSIFASVHRTLDDMFDPNGHVGKNMYANSAIAQRYNKHLVTYEGGQHYASWTNVPGDIIAPMNRRPEMYDVYKHFLKGWESIPNSSTLVFFAACTPYNEDEAFGFREYYDQDSLELYKKNAVIDWLKQKKAE